MGQHSRNDVSSLPWVGLLAFGLATLLGCAGIIVSNPPGPNSISGVVVNDSTGQPVAGAIVLLEQPDASGIDRVVRSETTASDGSFAFVALMPGNYDVVTAASVTSSSGVTSTSATTVTLLVPPNTTLSRIPLVPQFVNPVPTGKPIGIGATVTTSGLGGVPISADVKLSALQGVGPQGTSPSVVTIPTFTGSTPVVSTAAGPACPACPAGTACADYELFVPSALPVWGTFNPAGTQYRIPPGHPVEFLYLIEGRAFVRGGNTPDCTPSSQFAPVIAGTLPAFIPNLNFVGCQ